MKQWYVVQVYAGYELEAKEDVERRIQERSLQEKIGEILVPAAKVKQFSGDQELKNEQLFPGYMFVEMALDPETRKPYPEAMKAVTSSLRVSKFLGGVNPEPVSSKEVARIVSQVKGEISLSVDKDLFSSGQEIEIVSGPFAGFVGIVENVDHEAEKLTIMVSIFGRMTPIMLDFNQVKQ